MIAAIPALALAALTFVAGAVIAAATPLPWWGTLAGALAAATLAAAVQASRRTTAAPRARRSAVVVPIVALVVAAATAGHARFDTAAARGAGPLLAFASAQDTHAPHEVLGVARDDATLTGTTARVDLSVERVDDRPVHGGLRLTLPAPVAPHPPLRAGDRIRATVHIELPREAPGFDYPAYLRARDIDVVARYPQHWSVEARGVGNDVTERLHAVRRAAIANIARTFPEPAAALVGGVLIGERAALPPDVAQDLRTTGTTHLIVVSGQNVALLIGVLVAGLTALMSRRRAALLALPLLPAYVVITGGDPPVVRAALMAVGIVLAGAVGRRTPGWIYLSYAVAIMLAVNPLLTRDVSFQLSATATAGVMLIAPPLRDALLAALHPRGGLSTAIIAASATASGASLAVLPVQAATFHSLSTVQVPANLLVAPLYEATALVGVPAALLGWWPPAAAVLGDTTRYAPEAFLATVHLLARAPAAVVPATATVLAGAVFYACLALGTRWLARIEPPALAPAEHPRGAITVVLALAAIGVWAAAWPAGPAQASVTVLDVGQGLAVLVRDGAAQVLVDGGPPDGTAIAALGRAGAARHIGAIVVTHSDADHAGGVPEVQERFTVDRVLRADADTTGASQHIDIGDRLHLTPRTTIEVLAPPTQAGTEGLRSDNDRALVLRVTIGARRVLIASDIEAAAERWLVASGQARADALVVPHHGSLTSSTPAFVRAVAAPVALVSVGRNNPFGHPRPEVLARYVSARLLRTDEHGDIGVRSDGVRLWVVAVR